MNYVLCLGLNFIRAEGWVFAHIGDEGYTESCAAEMTRYRRALSAEDILIFTDIKKKHRFVRLLLLRHFVYRCFFLNLYASFDKI